MNPHDGGSWLSLALAREQDGDATGAEAALLRAAAVSRHYRIRWTLAYFYYRHRNVPAFKRWMRAALEMRPGETASLFEMAQALGIEGAVLDKLVPDECLALGDYLNFAASQGTALRLVRGGCRQQLADVLRVCDRRFDSGDREGSVELWNEVVRARWIAMEELRPAGGALLADPQFSPERVPGGFAWRETAPAGVLLERSAGGEGLRVELTGKQPEQCELLALNLPVLPGHSYRLSANYRGAPVTEFPGVEWSVGQLGKAAVGTPLEFTVPKAGPAVRLHLRYGRMPGTTRVQGVLKVASVSLGEVTK